MIVAATPLYKGMMTKRVVFLHGSPGSAAVWSSLIARAPADVECFAFDLLDHGAAPAAPRALVDDVVDDVVTRVRALGGPVVLVGHSFGAWVAGRALPQLDGLVTKFVALAGVCGVDSEIAARSLGFADALEAGQLTLDGAVGAAASLWLPAAGPKEEETAILQEIITGSSVTQLVRVLRRQAAISNPAIWVARHDVPGVAIHARGDRGVPLSMGKQLAALGSKTEFVELDGDSHFPQWSHPEVVTQAVFET